MFLLFNFSSYVRFFVKLLIERNVNISNELNFSYVYQWFGYTVLINISRLLLSRSRRDPLKHFEISVLRHIRCAELRKIPIEQPNFTNEHVI